ncbi:uncharacterized protein LOC126892847 [Diabrotica virgifera virgifera]|uniref:Double jelly roll-like domain-containing protein n=1 Tax=Diabrotica virgifera virgifera TaxID=50390 RepID=A0ABM5L843_DIAVI|nr:uncharacterized protein LOC126892847 [Diabrotica virgifera virgifera]
MPKSNGVQNIKAKKQKVEKVSVLEQLLSKPQAVDLTLENQELLDFFNTPFDVETSSSTSQPQPQARSMPNLQMLQCQPQLPQQTNQPQLPQQPQLSHQLQQPQENYEARFASIVKTMKQTDKKIQGIYQDTLHKILNKIARSNTELPIKFRSWELIEYSTLNNSTRHTWPVKTTTKLESLRNIVVAFHDGRKGKMLKDMSKFDHCNLRNIRMFLNSERYPYQNLNLDFVSNRFATFYEMFANFQESYYSRTPLLESLL